MVPINLANSNGTLTKLRLSRQKFSNEYALDITKNNSNDILTDFNFMAYNSPDI